MKTIYTFKQCIDKSKFKIFNNCLYEINDAGVIQHSFEKIGKIKVIPRVVSSLNYNSSGIYDGVVIENIYGKYNAIIPYAYIVALVLRFLS